MELIDTVSSLENGKNMRKRCFFTMSSVPYEMCRFSERSVFASLVSSLNEFFLILGLVFCKVLEGLKECEDEAAF
jgi:hypothetical protein